MDDNSSSCFQGMSPFYQSHWWVYIIISVAFYVIGFVSTALAQAGWKILKAYGYIGPRGTKCIDFLIRYAGERSRFSISLECLAFVLNGVYLCLYVVRTYYKVVSSLDNTVVLALLAVEVCLSTLLLIPLIVRVIQTTNPLLAWFSYFTIVDVLTLPHPFVSFVFTCDWVGLRNLRFLSLNGIKKILVQLRIIHSSLVAEGVSLLVTFITIWLASAGMVYLLEVSGDPWNNFSNAQSGYYLEYVYFAMTTMTTVGYGDFSPVTAFGRVFVTFFMIAGLALFALALGPITDYLAADKKYYTWYSVDPTRPHIVVCGDMDRNRMYRILDDFLHPDRVSVFERPDIVFLKKDFPSTGTKQVVHKYFPHAYYLIGSMFRLKDLNRVQLRHAAACVIMTDTTLKDQEDSDGTAIMRYIAVKNYSDDVRVIMQVSKSSTAKRLEALPVWNLEKDLVFCVNEWRLGWLSAACCCPGLSTVLGNLICPVSLPKRILFSPKPNLYLEGASLEIYCTELPQVLTSKKAREVILICRTVCDLTLIAVEVNGELNTNPASLGDEVLHPHTVGYFIAENRKDLKALKKLTSSVTDNVFANSSIQFSSDVCPGTPTREVYELNGLTPKPLSPPAISSRPLPVDLTDHYVLCLFADKESPVIDLTPFSQPLLQTSEDYLIVLAQADYAKKLANTDAVQKFGNIHVVVGSPLDMSCLEQAQVSKCKHCALLTVSTDENIDELALTDKRALLCLRLLEGMQHESGGSVPFVVELLEEENVQFVYLDDEDEGVEQVQLSTPYSRGSVVTMGMVDLLLATSFYNAQSTKIVQTLLKNPSISKIPTTELSTHVSTFMDAFEHILSDGNTLVGIMRLADENAPNSFYPITAPKSCLTLKPSDLLLVLK